MVPHPLLLLHLFSPLQSEQSFRGENLLVLVPTEGFFGGFTLLTDVILSKQTGLQGLVGGVSCLFALSSLTPKDQQDPHKLALFPLK